MSLSSSVPFHALVDDAGDDGGADDAPHIITTAIAPPPPPHRPSRPTSSSHSHAHSHTPLHPRLPLTHRARHLLFHPRYLILYALLTLLCAAMLVWDVAASVCIAARACTLQDETRPEARVFFFIEVFVTTMYGFDIALRLLANRRRFFRRWLNLLDLLLFVACIAIAALVVWRSISDLEKMILLSVRYALQFFRILVIVYRTRERRQVIQTSRTLIDFDAHVMIANEQYAAAAQSGEDSGHVVVDVVDASTADGYSRVVGDNGSGGGNVSTSDVRDDLDNSTTMRDDVRVQRARPAVNTSNWRSVLGTMPKPSSPSSPSNHVLGRKGSTPTFGGAAATDNTGATLRGVNGWTPRTPTSASSHAAAAAAAVAVAAAASSKGRALPRSPTELDREYTEKYSARMRGGSHSHDHDVYNGGGGADPRGGGGSPHGGSRGGSPSPTSARSSSPYSGSSSRASSAAASASSFASPLSVLTVASSLSSSSFSPHDSHDDGAGSVRTASGGGGGGGRNGASHLIDAVNDDESPFLSVSASTSASSTTSTSINGSDSSSSFVAYSSAHSSTHRHASLSTHARSHSVSTPFAPAPAPAPAAPAPASQHASFGADSSGLPSSHAPPRSVHALLSSLRTPVLSLNANNNNVDDAHHPQQPPRIALNAVSYSPLEPSTPLSSSDGRRSTRRVSPATQSPSTAAAAASLTPTVFLPASAMSSKLSSSPHHLLLHHHTLSPSAFQALSLPPPVLAHVDDGFGGGGGGGGGGGANSVDGRGGDGSGLDDFDDDGIEDGNEDIDPANSNKAGNFASVQSAYEDANGDECDDIDEILANGDDEREFVE